MELWSDLVAEEGLCLGRSSRVNVAGAIRLARDRYQSTLYDPGFLRERGLPAPRWLDDGWTTAE